MSFLPPPDICILTDDDRRGDEVSAMLGGAFSVIVLPLQSTRSAPPGVASVIVAADLRCVGNIEALKALLPRFRDASRRLFLLNRNDHSLVVQACALGSTDVILPPITANMLRARFPAADAASLAMEGCAAALRSVFTEMSGGGLRGLAQARQATDQIIDSIAAKGLSAWLDTVRRHHEGTFQHCLLVAGIAVDFGMSLGFSGSDLHNLGLAATLHDVGKTGISLGILDKPVRLDPRERKLIEQHPAIGYDCIKDIRDLSIDVADAVLHHHEYLDGSGYPDRLTAPQITDLPRIITIVDVFSALIERRSYKPPMSRTAAYEILSGMQRKLERPLVAAFKEVALQR